ncbi:MAG: hypothetical protein SGI88_20455 [Candidatus Hydrogenedentes bacterium]|nr:hypothetical protein [Candidatus Hydrogenedentota bacterium]
MPSSDLAPLRIYCVCGQKMKVSEDMYGRPGKCVACRQKIRIPRPDELPENTGVIHLKDYPQFLRKVKKSASRDHAHINEEIEVAPLPDLEHNGKARKAMGPLDILEPLRTIHSLLTKIERRMAALKTGKDENGSEDAAKRDPKFAELLARRSKVRAAQQDLEEELRQRLMETAIELSATQEKIAELNLGVRVGEITFDEYRAQVDRIRRRRDNHERRQTNLRGWLTVDDAYGAGGYVDMPIDHVPRNTSRIAFSNEIDDSVTLFDAHVDGLRHALARRANAERKLNEVKKMKPGVLSERGSMEELRAEARADLERSRALVQYSRERLEQLADDCSNDVQAAEAQLDHMRGRLQAGQIKREVFTVAEDSLTRAKIDLTKARALVVRALNANNAEEVPRARGTFVARLARGRPGLRAPMDAWVAWAGAALVLLSLFIPIANGATPLQLMRIGASQAASTHWFATFPILIAVIAAAASLIPGISARGLAYCAVWLMGSLLAAAFVHEARYSSTPAAAALHIGGPMLLRPGILVYSIGLLGVAAAACMALLTTRDGRRVLPIAAIASLAGLGAVATDMGGIRVPNPEMRVQTKLLVDSIPAVHEATVSIVNTGGRELVLARNSTAANAYQFSVERRIGKNSGIDVNPPVSIIVGQTPVPSGGVPLPRIPVTQGQAATFVYHLPQGDYRVTLQGVRNADRQENSFSLESLPAAETIPNPPASETAQMATPAAAQQSPGVLTEALSASVSLRGVVVAGNRPAQFSISVTLPDGAMKEQSYAIGDEVFTGWRITEFNPEEQTVTIARGSRIVILRRGEPQLLDPRGL